MDSSFTGSNGGEWRYRLKDTDVKERHDHLEQMIGREIPGVSLESFKFIEPESLDKPVELHYQLTAHEYARLVGPLLLVRPRVVGSDSLPSDDKPRSVPIDLSATGHWHDSYNISLPSGYVVDELPDAANVDTDFASYHSKFSAKGNVLHYERDYMVRKVELPATKEGEFAHLEGVIGSDERATAVLKKQ
jgi:hypothetical protein